MGLHEKLSAQFTRHALIAMRAAEAKLKAKAQAPKLTGPGATPFPNRPNRKALLALGLILAAFLAIECFLPLGTAVQIGADEGFNLAKATLMLKGFRLYRDVWSDQPPLHTYLITQVLKHISPSILGPRLVTVDFAVILLASLFLLALRVSGQIVAAVTTALVVASPGFLELASSCMLEIPALATGLAALAVLSASGPSRWYLREMLSGAIFGAALQIKFSPAILFPLAALIITLQHVNSAGRIRSITSGLLALAAGLAFAWLAIDLLIDRGDYLAHFHQSWSAHFAAPKSSEYGSANDHRFDWTILLKNWDTTVPSIFGIWVCLCSIRRPSNAPPLPSSDVLTVQRFNGSTALIPLAWLTLSLSYFAIHKPWWTYYYIHIAIPLCWCAAIGIDAVKEPIFNRRYRRFPIGTAPPSSAKPPEKSRSTLRRSTALAFAAYALCGSAWMAGRLYLQATAIRNSPQTYYDLVLVEIQRFKPFTQWMYAEDPIYSFHTGIPVPPQLAIVSLKRLWSGEMTNARIAAEVQAFHPGLILLRNDARALPFQDLMDSEYRLVYQDDRHRLYAHRTISRRTG